MHAKLSKSPITYVLAQVRFTNIENIGQYIPLFQDKARTLFPHFQTVTLQTIPVYPQQQPISTVTQWHFLDKNKKNGVVLDGQSISMHTSCYIDFLQLLESFAKALKWANETLNIALFTRIGLRYINLIDTHLEKIDTGLRGFQWTDDSIIKNEFLTKTETNQRTKQGMIKVQATHIGDKRFIAANSQNPFVPPDLAELANLLSFEEQTESKKDFLFLDLDHFSNKQGDFSIPEITKGLKDMEEYIYQIFCKAVGSEIIKNWK